MNKVLKVIITFITLCLWTFLWWLCGFNFNERSVIALFYTISTIWISINVYDAL